MGRASPSFVLGYHGCDRETAAKVVRGLEEFQPSDEDHDWLGPGIYFWEADVQRAFEWAGDRCARKGGDPAVLGAVIDLGDCLDLLSRSGQDLLRYMHGSLKALYEKAAKPLPENEPMRRSADPYRKIRKLDCAVIRHAHELADDPDFKTLSPFDTVRGMFTEGDELYEGTGFFDRSHIQISVRNSACIKGVFLPPELKQSL